MIIMWFLIYVRVYGLAVLMCTFGIFEQKKYMDDNFLLKFIIHCLRGNFKSSNKSLPFMLFEKTACLLVGCVKIYCE